MLDTWHHAGRSDRSPGTVAAGRDRYLRERQITLMYDPAAATLDARTGAAPQTITLTAN
jgi:hypothetical protein